MSSFSKLDHVPTRTFHVDNREYLFFGGTSYLGMGASTEFQSYCFEGAKKFGFSIGTSRSNNVQLGIYEDAETEAAKRFGAESALIASSGFLVGQLVIRYFAGFGEMIYGPNSHPALWLDAKPDNHLSFDEWTQQTVDYINTSNKTHFVIITDSLNNFRPQLYDFSGFSRIKEEKEIVLVVDDSHGIGVTHQGRGIFASLPSQSHIQKVVLASLAKGVGVDAGIVLSSREVVSELKTSPTFLAASPPSPALLYAFIKSGHIYRQNRERLEASMHFFTNQNLSELHYTPGFPVYYSENPELYSKLLEKEIVISSFNYPSFTDPLMNRIVINSLHTDADLLYLSEYL